MTTKDATNVLEQMVNETQDPTKRQALQLAINELLRAIAVEDIERELSNLDDFDEDDMFDVIAKHMPYIYKN